MMNNCAVKYITYFSTLLLYVQCTTTPPAATFSPAFAKYWMSGNAEVNTYRLENMRYGEMRQGDAVLIFVTEELSNAKQVKLDNAEGIRESEKTRVLKLNRIQKFKTGIYDYSMMQSVFTPIQQAASTMKTTTTIQEWCGQTFLQCNLKNNMYHFGGYSYFEQEGDQKFSLPMHLLEDELWTRLRLAPDKLPIGKTPIITGAFYTQLAHTPIGIEQATLTMIADSTAQTLTLQYSNNRVLKIVTEKTFPFKIMMWEEWQNNNLTARATLRSSRQIPYWQMNKNQNATWRDTLGLN